MYYLYEYAYSFMLHGDGDIYLIYFEYANDRLCYTVMQKDIAESDIFRNLLEEKCFYDWETPYGYGGPLSEDRLSIEGRQAFFHELSEYCIANKIVSQFVRFHPLLKNYELMPEIIEIRYLRDTIFIDTSDPEVIYGNMDSKNRNMIRKALKNNVSIVKRDISESEEFIRMYNETMLKNGADNYYIFDEQYFSSLNRMRDNAFILYAMYNDIPISSAIILYNDRFMHYHLSGSHAEYRNLAAGNLLLYEAACIAAKEGIKQFHLGGGMSPDDKLFGFKKQFNKNGRASFVVGRTIFDTLRYKELISLRQAFDADFDADNGFMIQYRR